MAGVKMREVARRVCENPDCDKPGAMPLMSEDGKHNFAPHIIDGEQKTVCMDCKMKLLQDKRPRNGF